MSRPRLRAVTTTPPGPRIGERLDALAAWAAERVPELPAPLAVSALVYLASETGEEPTPAAVRKRAAAIRASWERDWQTTDERG